MERGNKLLKNFHTSSTTHINYEYGGWKGCADDIPQNLLSNLER